MADKPRQKHSSSPLTTGSLKGHVRRIALPMSIGFFFNTMYNVVDSFYVGRISTEALAAMALSFPVFFIIIAVSEGLARGASALIGNAIGEKDVVKEEELSGQVISLGVLCAVGLTCIGLLVAEPLFRLMGASGDYLNLAVAYIHPIFWGSGLFITGSMANAILLAHGDSKIFGKVLVGSFLLNLVLDPWFLYGGMGLPAMGITGIALATLVTQFLSSGYLLWVVVRRGYLVGGKGNWLVPKLRVYRDILRQGVPTSFNMMSVALGFFVTTYYLNLYGEVAVAAFGVGTRIEQIMLLPALGISTALVSIVGQNNGAGRMDRVREGVQICVRYGLVLILTVSALMYVFAESMVGVFTEDPAVVETGTQYVRIAICIQWGYVMSFLHIGFLQAMKRPMYGFCESVLRKLILPALVFYLLVRVYDVELITFWWGMILINVVMTIVTISYARWVLKRLPTDVIKS